MMETWLSASVPLGFVVGAVISAYFGLADRINTRKLFAISAVVGGFINLCLISVGNPFLGILLRLLTGFTLAGVYPISVKIISEWFPKQRGIATGILIGALSLGSAFPHFISLIFISLDSDIVILTTSVLSMISAFLIRFVLKDAKNIKENIPFSIGMVKKVIKNRPVMLANYGYFGHMWELYGMWTWLPLFLSASFINYSSTINPLVSTLISFISIGIAGAIGCIIGGVISDKFNRSTLTVIAMVTSASCAILIGFTYGNYYGLTILLAVMWGASAVADSAQFSVVVSEFSDIEYVGTALTFQMCIGYIFTVISINLISILQPLMGWEWVFSLLSIGPIIGIVAMIKFRKYELGKSI